MNWGQTGARVEEKDCERQKTTGITNSQWAGSFLRFAVLKRLLRRQAADRRSSGTNAKPLACCLVGLTLVLWAPQAFSQSIHQLSYAGPNWTWTDTDLTSLTGSAEPGFYSGMTGFITTPNDQFHIYYQDGSNNIHQLYFSGNSWSDENLTTTTKGATALVSGSGIKRVLSREFSVRLLRRIEPECSRIVLR